MLARAGSLEDAIVGVRPGRVLTPASIDEAAELVRATTGQAIAVVGGGSELELGAAPARLDVVLRTTGLHRLIEHAPADQIVSVEAGVTLAALQQKLAAAGQRLALDAPNAERATIGGLIATNASGPLRAGFGSLRDLLLGLSFIRADGTRAKGGGKVVKNVAGFDLPKLMIGALGTLGVIVSATLRLHPLPEASATLLYEGLGAAAAWEWVRRLRAAQLEPCALAVVDGGEGGDGLGLGLRYEGFAAGVGEQRDATLALAAAHGEACRPLDGDEAAAWWRRAERLRVVGGVRAHLGALPSALAAVYAAVVPRLRRALGDGAFVWYPTAGSGYFAAAAPAFDAARAAAAIAEARAALVALGGWLTLAAAPLELRTHIDEWGAPPPSWPLMRRIKERFDPERRLNPGRFVGGL